MSGEKQKRFVLLSNRYANPSWYFILDRENRVVFNADSEYNFYKVIWDMKKHICDYDGMLGHKIEQEADDLEEIIGQHIELFL